MASVSSKISKLADALGTALGDRLPDERQADESPGSALSSE